MKTNELAILVNSTDTYEDCWDPFFELFFYYWPGCPYPIYLNTETKEFRSSKLDVISTRVAPRRRHIFAWSDMLSRCLGVIDAEYVLYLQEDYFLRDFVDGDMIAILIDVMNSEDYSHIRLIEASGCARSHYRPCPTSQLLWEIPQRSDYRISLQAGLWRKETLHLYLSPGESAWEFERRGTIRARRGDDSFFCLNPELFDDHGRYVYPYTPTGIIRGKWFGPAVVGLFAEHRINIDFAKRGLQQTGAARLIAQSARSRLRRMYMSLVW